MFIAFRESIRAIGNFHGFDALGTLEYIYNHMMWLLPVHGPRLLRNNAGGASKVFTFQFESQPFMRRLANVFVVV